MGTRFSALLAGVSLAVVSGTGAATSSGLYGHVRRGPVMPVCRSGVPCFAPTRAPLIFSRGSDAPAVRVVPAVDGSYRIVLAPGFYAVTTTPRTGSLKPARVRIRAGHMDRVDFLVDTGIR